MKSDFLKAQLELKSTNNEARVLSSEKMRLIDEVILT